MGQHSDDDPVPASRWPRFGSLRERVERTPSKMIHALVVTLRQRWKVHDHESSEAAGRRLRVLHLLRDAAALAESLEADAAMTRQARQEASLRSARVLAQLEALGPAPDVSDEEAP